MDTLEKHQPAALFSYEVDSLVDTRSNHSQGSQRHIQSLLLSRMAVLKAEEHGVLIICTTNPSWSVDDAFHRQLRTKNHVPPPDSKTEALFCKQALGKFPFYLEEQSIMSLGKCLSSKHATPDDYVSGIEEGVNDNRLKHRDAIAVR